MIRSCHFAVRNFRIQMIIRLSPRLAVIFRWSKYSSSGIAYFLDTPAISLNFATSISLSGVPFANDRTFSISCSAALDAIVKSALTRTQFARVNELLIELSNDLFADPRQGSGSRR